MTTSSTYENHTNIVHETTVDGGWSGQLRIVRATGKNGQELVFIHSDLLGNLRLVLTPQQAADVAEAVHDASGLETSTRRARFLAEVHRMDLARRGVTRTALRTRLGISGYRLRGILAGEVPMTHDEHVAISEAQA